MRTGLLASPLSPAPTDRQQKQAASPQIPRCVDPETWPMASRRLVLRSFWASSSSILASGTDKGNPDLQWIVICAGLTFH